jgi:hypothetical protein
VFLLLAKTLFIFLYFNVDYNSVILKKFQSGPRIYFLHN